MRGADTGPVDRILALQALWAGVFYDEAARDAALELTTGWTREDRHAARGDANRLGLKATIAGRSVQEIAKDFLAISAGGLKNRARLDANGSDERQYLAPLEAIADSGVTPSERLIELYNGKWAGDVSRAYEATAY